MKIAVSGKGGVGKTTLSACLARYYAQKGQKVIAVDADPDANLAAALGMDMDQAADLVPLTDMKELVEERTGAKPGGYGAYFKLNPKVDDIAQKFGVDVDGVTLLLAGTIKAGGAGCYCPENVLLKRLFNHLVVARDEVVIMDMEAGIEHLGRGTCQSMDMLIIVVEPGMRSVQTAYAVKKMAQDLQIKSLFIVVNKIQSTKEFDLVNKRLADFTVLGQMPYSEKVRESDLGFFSPCQADKTFQDSIAEIGKKIDQFLLNRQQEQ